MSRNARVGKLDNIIMSAQMRVICCLHHAEYVGVVKFSVVCIIMKMHMPTRSMHLHAVIFLIYSLKFSINYIASVIVLAAFFVRCNCKVE